MLATRSKGQITLPDAVMNQFPEIDAFEASTDGTCIILRPFQGSNADAVRERLAAEDLTEADVADAIAWARSSK